MRLTLSKSNDSQNLSLDLDSDELAALPFPLFETGATLGNLSCHGHHQGNGMFGGGSNITRR
jgi:hypothetical protein